MPEPATCGSRGSEADGRPRPGNRMRPLEFSRWRLERDGCPSTLTLWRLAAGELDAAQTAAIEHNTTVAIFSLEMSKEQLVLRLLCSEGRVDAQKLHRFGHPRALNTCRAAAVS